VPSTRILASVLRIFPLTRREWLLALAFGLALIVFLGVHVWSALLWDTRFNSDEATLGLMAKHMMDGTDFPVYFYGVRYGGSLPSLLAVPFLWLFGVNVMSLHLSVIVLLGIFAILQTIWVQRHFGNGVAIMSLLILAFPGYTLLSFLTVISTRMATYLVLWMCSLFLYEASAMRTWLRAVLFGLLLGLCFWTQPLTLHYFLAIGTAWILQSDEWARLREKLSLPDWGWILIFIACLLGGPTLVFSGNAAWLVLPLFVIALSAFTVSTRKNTLLFASGMIVLGTLIGTAPQWILWLKEGITISQPYIPTFPDRERLLQLLRYTFPSLWGVRPIPELHYHPLSFRLSSLFIALIVPAALLSFGWRQRKELANFVRLRPLTKQAMPYVLLTLLFCLPLIAQLGMDGDEGSVRYLVPAWQASAVITALFFVHSWMRWKILGVALAAMWFFHMAYSNMDFASKAWSNRIHDMKNVQTLTAYLQARDATHGYADFWVAYVLDYLSEERITLDYYDGHIRYKPYHTAISAARKQSYVFATYWHDIPTDNAKLETLIAGIRDNMKLRGQLPEVIFDELKKKRVLSREKVATWDVWIVENPIASQ